MNALTPLLIAAGLMPLTQRGTGVPLHLRPGYTPNPLPFPLPSELMARLAAASRRG